MPGSAQATRRLELLDALRGFALLGVPLLDARSITLFALLFGAGFAMQSGGTRPCKLRMPVLQQSVAHRRFWARLLRASFGVGVAAGTLLLMLQHGDNRVAAWLHGGAGLVLARLLRDIAPLSLCLFCMAGFVLLFQQAAWRRWLCKLAPMGRMALTNFLAQTLVGLGLFHGIGLGPGPRVGPLGVALAGLAIFGLQALFSCWWLGRFRFGPAEWVWHSLVHGKPQPMRLRAPPAAQGGVALVMRSVAGGANGLPALM
ncbi:hypothetical protein A3K87_15210 [Variovorax paradoxus]|uniref:DUF418 domain-containing protein n=1 Tax=Variovorax paradoxus TaxID=34073 RepID=A0AA91DQI0_VARPD|nr:hypothetical protein C4F17_10165 [Variovorax sp. PMC12]OAK63953.1 hypothetical protein A3K87_15210 [Variovorax paradoxus]